MIPIRSKQWQIKVLEYYDRVDVLITNLDQGVGLFNLFMKMIKTKQFKRNNIGGCILLEELCDSQFS